MLLLCELAPVFMPQPDWPFELLRADGKGAIKNLKAPTAQTAHDLQTTNDTRCPKSGQVRWARCFSVETVSKQSDNRLT